MLIPSMKAFHLGHLLPNQSAEISQIDAELGLQQRLYALGFRQGQRIEVLRRAWLSGPLHVRLGTTEVMVRRRDANCIHLVQSPAA
jgi:ferrous iron transport protein A